MQDSKPGSFAQELQRRGIIQKAEAFCASWTAGFIAQDADGVVWISNAVIEPRSKSWRFTGWTDEKGSFYRLTELPATNHWRKHILPVQAVWQEQPELCAEQQAFYNSLFAAGMIEKTKGFLTAWESDVWLAMDKNGFIYIYNCEPRTGETVWRRDGTETSHFFLLDVVDCHHLDWVNCRAKLSAFRVAPCPMPASPLAVPNRMDCWL